MHWTSRWLALWAAALVVFAPGAALAHPAPFSYIDVVIGDEGIEGTVVVHVYDAAHDLNVTPQERLFDLAFLDSQRVPLGALLSPRMNLRVGGRVLVPEWTGIE